MIIRLDRRFSQGSPVSAHSKTTEMPKYEPMREILDKLLHLVHQSLLNIIRKDKVLVLMCYLAQTFFSDTRSFDLVAFILTL